MTIALLQQSVDNVRRYFGELPSEVQRVTAKDVFGMARKLHYAAYVVHTKAMFCQRSSCGWPTWISLGTNLRGGREACARLRKKAEAGRVVELTPKYVVDVEGG